MPWDDFYEPVVAHLGAHERAKCPKVGRIESSRWLRTFIESKLNKRWSPEQTHLHRRRHHGGEPATPGLRRDDLPVPLPSE